MAENFLDKDWKAATAAHLASIDRKLEALDSLPQIFEQFRRTESDTHDRLDAEIEKLVHAVNGFNRLMRNVMAYLILVLTASVVSLVVYIYTQLPHPT